MSDYFEKKGYGKDFSYSGEQKKQVFNERQSYKENEELFKFNTFIYENKKPIRDVYMGKAKSIAEKIELGQSALRQFFARLRVIYDIVEKEDESKKQEKFKENMDKLYDFKRQVAFKKSTDKKFENLEKLVELNFKVIEKDVYEFIGFYNLFKSMVAYSKKGE